MSLSLFRESQQELDEIKSLDPVTEEAPEQRITTPAAIRGGYEALKLADDDSSFNRSLIDGMTDYSSPHDDEEMENKGQGDNFNFTTGEGAAILAEAVSGFVDIYTTPAVLADIPLDRSIDRKIGDAWSKILAEEYTTMERGSPEGLASHMMLCQTYVKHGVVIPYFDDKEAMDYTVGGLDHFKFPRKTGIVSSKFGKCFALGNYEVTELFRKIGGPGWSESAIRKAIVAQGKQAKPDWSDWEEMQRQIKANEILVDTLCEQIEVVHGWVREFDGSISYYIAAKSALPAENGETEEFLYHCHGHYDNVDQFFQIFPFGVGNGGRLYTVRGLGYLVYQICSAGDILHCKMLNNAMVGSSLILQPASTEDAQDMMLIDAGGAIMIPPTMKMPERQMGINLNNSLVPAMNANSAVLNRTTGGLAAGGMMLNDDSSRETKLEVSSKLDFMNKLSSFAVTLFYAPFDNVTREKVRRAYSVPQKDPVAKERVRKMKKRCMDRGVPETIFSKIDFDQVKATRIIGTGSRSSRIMLFEQIQQGYGSWDLQGRRNFDYDRLVQLGGIDLADRYAGKPEETRTTHDEDIATLENMLLTEGHYIAPKDGQLHMAHLPIHIDELEVDLQAVNEGQIDLIEWTTENSQIYQHVIATLEMTVVAESVQPTLNQYHQRAQQIGELVVNGMKSLNKAIQDGEMDAPQEGQTPEVSEEEKIARKTKAEMESKDMLHKQKLQQQMELGLLKLQQIKQSGEWRQVAESQKAMSNLVSKDAEASAKLRRAQASQI